jgi:hypothetical protein
VKRNSYILLLIALAPVLFVGCGGDGPVGPTGPQGPPGPPGRPPPLKILFAGYDLESSIIAMIKITYREELFPLGTEIGFVNLIDSVPSLETFLKYDATLCWTIGTPASAAAIGNVLADYVDNGGGLVLAQGAFSQTGQGPIGGRIMTTGYSPLIPGPASIDTNIHYLDSSSLTMPLHPMFNGTDVDNFRIFFQPNFSNPELDPTATLLGLDTGGNNAIAINAAENVVGVNMTGAWWFNYEFYTESIQFMANALVYVGGGFGGTP